MAAIDYHGILTSLAAILEADASLAGSQVVVEQDPTFDLQGSGSAIVLTLDSRREAAGQPLAAGKRTRWHVRVSCWVVGFGMSFEEAAERRDSIVGALELVLMNNRTVNGKVAAGWIEGGEFITVNRQSEGSFAMAETVLICEALAVAA